MTKLITVEEAAKRLGLSTGGVYKLLRRGDLPSVKIGQRSRRIAEHALEDFIERHTSAAL